MRFIGITGGVGAGKSEILGYLAKKPDTRVMLADEIAHELMSPGTECYDRICETFGAEDIFLPQGGLNRGKLAAVIFSDEAKRRQMNAIVHPAVRVYVEKEAAREKQGGKRKLLVLEAALLIGYSQRTPDGKQRIFHGKGRPDFCKPVDGESLPGALQGCD